MPKDIHEAARAGVAFILGAVLIVAVTYFLSRVSA